MILVKDIILKGNPDLEVKCSPVSLPVSRKDLSILKSMMRYLERSQDEKLCTKYGLKAGVGLAAPQIDIKKRMLAMYIEGDTVENTILFGIINPEILAESVQMIYLPGGEACLSIPGVKGNVLRHQKVRFKALFFDYKKGILTNQVVELRGYPAIVFQHEFDHLNGILFTDKIVENTGNALPCEF